ncbi:hypothetical protein M9Y10_007138 [Tritrichomonas musculus]|uniref:G domain-containing protein n=1 Tax=Tritrichomonas musculus TaxID=1915356 RepID=A0ABR2J1D0_9EUKA
MDFENIDYIERSIKSIENEIRDKIKNYNRYHRIILLGLTGSGKSSVARCLAKESIEIEVNGKDVHLTGTGIFAGSTSGTDIPVIYADDENKALYCDCPGFEDTRGMDKEIINAFSDDFLLTSDGNDIYVKILLVVSASEFNTGRGKVILDTFKRLKKMFPNPEQVKDSIGFVITKGEEDVNGTYYFTKLEEKACTELKTWCDYFKMRKNQVFLFPQAKKENEGRQYKFNDFDKLMDFLKFGFIKNPDHEITLSDSSLSNLNFIRIKHLQSIHEIVKELFLKINVNYRESNDSETLSLWLNIMHNLMDQKISKISDFRKIIEKYVPNCEQYEEYFSKLDDYETIDSFIDRIYDVDTITSSLQDIFRNMIVSAQDELKRYQVLAENSEIQEKLIKEKTEMIQRYKDDLQEEKDKIDQMKIDFEEEQKKYDEKERENNEKLIRMNNEIISQQKIYQDKQKEYDEQIGQMNNKILDQQRIMDEKTREHKEKLEQLYDDLQNQHIINDKMKKECSDKIEQIEKMKQEFFDLKNIQSQNLKEYKESLDILIQKVEKQDTIINGLYNKLPVIVEGGGICLLI